MIFSTWGKRWNVPAEALSELVALLGASDILPNGANGSEAMVQTKARLRVSRAGWRVWRNNVGAFRTDEGGFVRYGLANDTKAVNQSLKSSDLIGIRPVLITPNHVGATLGQFVALEIKEPSWKFSGKGREVAQLRYIGLVSSLGGYARFVRNEDDLPCEPE